jgi:hypothetical protein
MGKIKLTEQNLGQVFNFRHWCMLTLRTSFTTAKRTNLKWKTWSKQLLGSLPLAFAWQRVCCGSDCIYPYHCKLEFLSLPVTSTLV